jgi:S-adenosyl-L-methionine hydrolase (adenosine-forming)
MTVVTLLTDFGHKDPYVGVMKGVILGIAADARIVDVTHEVGAQNLREANFALHGAWHYFPAGSVHLVVVDPGVGSERRILAVAYGGHLFLAPDNGVLSGICDAAGAESRVVTAQRFFRAGKISRTFHGRDIFAPVAAHLAAGRARFDELGEMISDPIRLEMPEPALRQDGALAGRVAHVDAFGNLITNVRESMLGGSGRAIASVELLGHRLEAPRESYASVAPGQPLTIIDSFDYLEIAVRGGSAAAHFNARVGDEVRVRFA